MGPGGSGLGQLKPDTTGSSHTGRQASEFSTFLLVSNIIYIPSLGVKTQSDADTPIKGQEIPYTRACNNIHLGK